VPVSATPAQLGRAVALGGGVAIALLAARELEGALARSRSAAARPRSTFASPPDPVAFAHADEVRPGVSDAFDLEPPLQDDALHSRER
jgi:hypothetical protein